VCFHKGVYMVKRALMAASAIMPLLIGCDGRGPVSPSNETPAFAPAGNGNKQVFTVDEPFSTVCPGGAVLAGHLGGWFQVMGGSGRNLELNVFHLVFTFTNAGGETFVFRDVGPDRLYVKDGNLFLAITGRSSGSGVIGHVVINLTTGEVVLVAGKEFGSPEAVACEHLT
jgi:hypothetical protein